MANQKDIGPTLEVTYFVDDGSAKRRTIERAHDPAFHTVALRPQMPCFPTLTTENVE
ncbi:hypothetical protein [Caballeronia grimmiae]|uniref:hypothetical protein n=1 Tax=Caballeronia grimmiae TaxID=1071679 RepID=UPI0038B8FA29